MRLPSMITPEPVTSCGVALVHGLYGSGRRKVEKILTTERSTREEMAGAVGAALASVSCAWAARLAAASRAAAAIRENVMRFFDSKRCWLTIHRAAARKFTNTHRRVTFRASR